MNIAIYGGSFNPPHNGHIQIVKYILDKIDLDKLIIMPVGIASHRDPHMVSPAMRFDMCNIAFSDIAKVEVSDIEVKSSKLCYTYDTLVGLKKIYGEGSQYYEIIGEDSLAYLDQWKNYRDLLEMCKIVVIKRQGYHGTITHKNIMLLDSPYFPYSSTQIREDVKKGLDISPYVTPDIVDYINKYKLYKYSKYE